MKHYHTIIRCCTDKDQNGDDLYGPCLKLSDDVKQVILIVTLGPDPSRFMPLDFCDDGKEVCGLATFVDNETESTTISCYQLK